MVSSIFITGHATKIVPRTIRGGAKRTNHTQGSHSESIRPQNIKALPASTLMDSDPTRRVPQWIQCNFHSELPLKSDLARSLTCEMVKLCWATLLFAYQPAIRPYMVILRWKCFTVAYRGAVGLGFSVLLQATMISVIFSILRLQTGQGLRCGERDRIG